MQKPMKTNGIVLLALCVLQMVACDVSVQKFRVQQTPPEQILTNEDDGGTNVLDSGTQQTKPDSGTMTMPDASVVVSTDTLKYYTSTSLPFIGTGVNDQALLGDSKYSEILGKEFNAVTPENAMTWNVIHPNASTWSFGTADIIVNAANANGQRVRGHPVIWHVRLPSYVTSLKGTALRTAFEEHIDGIIGHFDNKVAEWNVLNEVMDDNGVLRDSIFLRELGPSYIADALRRARLRAPNAVLMLSDYNIEGLNSKSDATYALVRDLLNQKVPLDAVGFAFHVSAYDAAFGMFAESAVRENIRRFASLGVKIRFTEVDVRTGDLPGTTDQKEAFQKEVYRLITRVCRQEPACEAITTWGFTDKYSWIPGLFGPDAALLLNTSYVRKPAYFGLREALSGQTTGSLVYPPLDSACTGALFGRQVCAGFENTRLVSGITMTDWFSSLSGGTVALSTARAFKGARSLRAAITPSVNAQALLGRYAFRNKASGSLYARTYIYVPSTSPIETLTVLGLNEAYPPYSGIAVNLTPGGVIQLALNTTAEYPSSTAAIPRDKWTCLELKIDLNALGTASIRMDGTEVISRSDVNTLPAKGYGGASVGILYASPNHEATEVFVDEFVADTAPIGCN